MNESFLFYRWKILLVKKTREQILPSKKSNEYFSLNVLYHASKQTSDMIWTFKQSFEVFLHWLIT